MSADKYPCIFSRQMETIVYVYYISTVSVNFQVNVTTLFIFIRMLFFPPQAEYSYFSADFRLKIFLYYS